LLLTYNSESNMTKLIDLRSDTVTKPTVEMRKAMNEAAVGDDVMAEDPTVNRLEQTVSELFHMESGLFVSSGTQGNLLALFSHCQRGDEYIAGQKAHNYLEEGGGGAVLASLQPQPIPNESDGTISLQSIKGAIKPDDFHFARTRLLCLENTWHGYPLPIEYLSDASKIARENGLRFHLDGARIFNAAVAQNIDVSKITTHFDSISACLSKGLGAPVGSVLCGSRQLIDDARRWRKVLGGGWRQAGMLAAAGLYAIENNIARLKIDHDRAALLAHLLGKIEEISVDNPQIRTNMVWIEIPEEALIHIESYFRQQGILISMDDYPLRLVTHLDLTETNIYTIADAFKNFFLEWNRR